MKTKIEALIKLVEQVHAEAELEGSVLADPLWAILNDLFWVYRMADDVDVT